MDSEARKRSWLIPTIGLAIVAVLTVIALLREPVTLDPDTPEGTVQTYLQAISDQDYDAAFDLLSSDTAAGCEPVDISTNRFYSSFTATLGNVEEVGDYYLVEVSIREGSDSGFVDAGPGYFPEPFRIELEEGEWVIAGDPWPYFTYSCDF